jgi:hypothetical protein
MQGKKTVRTRVLFQHGIFSEDFLDTTSTFNMADRAYLDRDPDMLLEDADGVKQRIVKSAIVGIREIKVIGQEVVEAPREKEFAKEASNND